MLVPTFPESTRGEITAEMSNQIQVTFLTLLNSQRVDRKRVGIIGISHGGTLALRAASMNSIRNDVAWIATLGAYSSFEDVVKFAFADQRSKIDPLLEKVFRLNFAIPTEQKLTAALVLKREKNVFQAFQFRALN